MFAAAPAPVAKKVEVHVTVHRTDKGFGIVLMSSKGEALIDGTSANARDAGLQKGDYVVRCIISQPPRHMCAKCHAGLEHVMQIQHLQHSVGSISNM